MEKFKKTILKFSLLLLLINGVFFLVKYILFMDYYKHSKEYNSYLLADSHGWYLGDRTETIGIANFSYYSDSYFDTERKLKYLIGRGKVDTVYISADDHSLSPYREFSNNGYKSIKYEFTQGDYEFTDLVLYNLQYYVVIFDPNIRAIISHFFNEQSENLLNFDNENTDVEDLPWVKLSEEDRVDLSEERLAEQFPPGKSSEKLKESLLNIIKICNKNNITLIGIKFPISDEYSSLIKNTSFGPESILTTNGIKIIDFKNAFHSSDKLFENPDHINGLGAQKLIDSLKVINQLPPQSFLIK